MRRAAFLAIVAVVLILGGGIARADDGDPTIGGQTTGRGIGISGTSGTPGQTAQPVGTASGPATRSTTCNAGIGVCPGAIATCTHGPIPAPPTVVVTETQQPDGTWRQTAVDCNGAAPDDALAVTADMVRQEVVRLLPPVTVGIAPATGPTLVNMETVFWSPTPTTRQLGPVTILGQPVAITIHFDHATYDYGDGTHATYDTPGTPWTETACHTAQCPTLDGHTYTTTADTLTTTSTITWTATYTVGQGAPQPIPGTVDGPTATHDLQVLQGRAVILR